MSDPIKRRELFKLAASSAVVVSILRAQGPHLFFTPAEFAIVDEFTEILIPADEKSGGARAAKVTEYLDKELSEAFDDDVRVKTRAAIPLIDKLSMKLNGVAFIEANQKQRVAVVTAMSGKGMSGKETDPKTPEQSLYQQLKTAAAHAYYTSKIGIEDLDYKGNVVQMREYSGELPSGPALGPTGSK